MQQDIRAQICVAIHLSDHRNACRQSMKMSLVLEDCLPNRLTETDRDIPHCAVSQEVSALLENHTQHWVRDSVRTAGDRGKDLFRART